MSSPLPLVCRRPLPPLATNSAVRGVFLPSKRCLQQRPASSNPSGQATGTAALAKRKERVVVLGSGWAGYAFARTLDPARYERVVVSPRSYFVFTPLLASTAVGTLEFRAVLEPVRRLGRVGFHQGWADDVDFERKVVRVAANTNDELSSRTLPPEGRGCNGNGNGNGDGKGEGEGTKEKKEKKKKAEAVNASADEALLEVPYDKLVVAVGAQSQTFGIEGVQENAHFLRDIGDARRIRAAVLRLFEQCASPAVTDVDRRRLLHFAVVGGGPTGIEFAAELHDLLHEDLARLYPALLAHVRITVYDIAPKVLPMFDRELADYAMAHFARQGIRVQTRHSLQRIRPDGGGAGGLLLKIKEHGDEEVGAGLVVWSTGLVQNPLVKQLVEKEIRMPAGGEGAEGEGEGEGGRGSDNTAPRRILEAPRTGDIVTDAHLRVRLDAGGVDGRVELLPDVFAIGDCASVENQALPKTAQVGSQQASHLAKRLNNNDVGSKPFKFRNLGVMAYIGTWKAIHQSRADELKGRAAWVLWRMAYLTKCVSVRNKIMVPVYWMVSWIFGRDISRF